MSLDVFNYEQLEQAKRAIRFPDESMLGKFTGGNDDSAVTGVGYDIEGLRDYQPGEDTRLVDYKKSASRSDGGLWVKELIDIRSPLNVFVSDIPSDRYARTAGFELSSRGLGFVTMAGLMEAADVTGGAIMPVWSDGEQPDSRGLALKFTDRYRVRRAIGEGLQLAESATMRTLERRSTAADLRDRIAKVSSRRAQKLGLTDELDRLLSNGPKPEPFVDVLNLAFNEARRYSDVGRFVLLSDFMKGEPDDLSAIVSQISRCGDVYAVRVINPALLELPGVGGLFTTSDGTSVTVENEQQRDRYRQIMSEKHANIKGALLDGGAKVITLETGKEDWVQDLVNGVKA